MATKSTTAPKADAPKPTLVAKDDAPDAPDAAEPTLKVQLKKKEFFERVVDRSGVRKGEAKTAVEAALAVLGEALANGEEVNLPPLGKIRVARQKSTPRGIAYNLRLVRNDVDVRLQPDEPAD